MSFLKKTMKNTYKIIVVLVLIACVLCLNSRNTKIELKTKNVNIDKKVNRKAMAALVKGFYEEEKAVELQKEKERQEAEAKAAAEKAEAEKAAALQKAKEANSSGASSYSPTNTNAGALKTLNGKLTAYVATCPGCSGRLGCTGQNVSDGTMTYNDNTFGNVFIVASSSNLPCGSIVRFNNNTLSNTGVITAIVLDRGVSGTTLDILVDSVETARTKVGSSQITYDVLRMGWNN